MRSLMIVTTSYPQNDADGAAAAGVFVADFARTLAQHLPVDVIAPADKSSRSENGALRVHRFAVPRLPLSLLSATRPSDWPTIVRTLNAGAAAVRAACAERCPAHILALWALPSGLWARSAARRYGIPYSTWALGSDIWTLGRVPVVRNVLRNVLRGAAQRFADGLQLAADVERIAGMPCAFLPSSRRLPRRLREQRPANAPLRLAFLGRWHPNKGVDLLLDALDLLETSDWAHIESVRIAGGGPLEREVRLRAQALRTHGRPVQDGDYLDLDGAADLLHWADWLLLPSRIESIPVVLSDALQAGLPIIATPVGDLPHLYARERIGYLADTVEAADYARTLHAALHDTPQRWRASTDRLATEFDVGSIVIRFLTALDGWYRYAP